MGIFQKYENKYSHIYEFIENISSLLFEFQIII